VNTYFNFVWLLLIVYAALYNYIYIGVVLPELEKFRGSSKIELMPSKQLADLDEYVRLFGGAEEKPWQYYPARHCRAAVAFLALLSLVGLLVAKL